MTIVAIGGKGGVGKTVIASIVTKILSEGIERKVLVIDADPATGLTDALGMGVEKTVSQLREDIIGNPFTRRELMEQPVKEAMTALGELRPVKYRHMSSPDEESVGFIAEDVPDLVATASRRSLSPVDLVAVLTRVVQEQQNTIEVLSRRVEELENKVNPAAGR